MRAEVFAEADSFEDNKSNSSSGVSAQCDAVCAQRAGNEEAIKAAEEKLAAEMAEAEEAQLNAERERADGAEANASAERREKRVSLTSGRVAGEPGSGRLQGGSDGGGSRRRRARGDKRETEEQHHPGEACKKEATGVPAASRLGGLVRIAAAL